ncbi:MFS transporter [Paracidovorax avenae]|uniref:MFS transporter n=1 Tax=Paracidovorax avenae TaxID=80867 RepID=UPI000D17C497|nr:MFS transporter [Paracidovorax avenae]AVS61980.1 MFS transporter [Paracidovorax avenae]
MATESNSPSSAPLPPGTPLSRNAGFRWLTASSALSLLGDQFSLIAMPWLVLQTTDDTRVLGTVLALMSVPRAVFILVGGAIVDRQSPLRVLRLTRWLNAALTGLLAALVLAGHCPLWALYALSLALGISTAFSIPAATSITPRVVGRAQLHAANSIGMGLRQVGMSVGPLFAGLLIAGFGGAGTQAADRTGIGFAFAVDALSFVVSAWMLGRVRLHAPAPGAVPGGAVLAAVAQGLSHAWRDRPLRTCFLYWGLLSILVMGPTQIALPVLTHGQPQLGAAAFGILVGMHGAGTLAGMVAAGALPRLRLVNLGTTLLAVDAVAGLLIAPLGSISAVWQGALLLGSVGLLGGFMQVGLFTWIQQRVPPALLGRTMGLFMFIFMGLQPVAAAATGWLLQIVPPGRLFLLCGGTLVLLAALAAVATPMRRMQDATP